ncbi:MAG TPA: low molecular weight protein-tyrosine-phosphatase [Kofleriaceae bacterium]|nr:low molecular weight protein-tyrosine-phosphatase [Kofleriaceae bacterium]
MKVLFVCLGNICRSPTAESVMRVLARDAGKAVELDSAGTGGWHVGEAADPRSRNVAARRGYPIDHRARQLSYDDFARFDLILAMDRQNLADIEKLARGVEHVPRIALFRSYDSTAESGAEVPDPYAGGAEGFERVVDICERACRGLLETL